MTRAERFRFDEMAGDRPMAGIRRRQVRGAQATVAELRLDAGVEVAVHQHPQEQIALILEGRMKFFVADGPGGEVREVILGPGEALLLPGGVPHGAEVLEDCRAVDVFAPPAERSGIDG